MRKVIVRSVFSRQHMYEKIVEIILIFRVIISFKNVYRGSKFMLDTRYERENELFFSFL